MNITSNIWLHLGAGSFHRAHQAVYLHRLQQQGMTDWSIALANIRDDATPLLTALAKQQGAYTLETVTPEGHFQYETITSIRHVIPWDAELAALIQQGADPATRIISFTVTEGGYYLNQHHQLDTSKVDLVADLRGGKTTIYGAITAILQARAAQGDLPVTLLSCDNVRHNGDLFRQALLEFLQLRQQPALAEWVTRNCSCPNSMVDRITPRPNAEVRQRVLAATGHDDPAALMGESFIQWVIEDQFVNGRPPLEQVGVEMVDSVLPYEEAKIRILNASHSCIAWAGTLVGKLFIHASTAVPSIRQMAHDYVTQDVIPCLTPSPLDLAAYRDTVLARFSNPYILDTNQRVAADGFSKIPGFIAPTLQQCYQRQARPRATALLPALFFVFLQQRQAGKLPYEYQDSMLQESVVRKMLNANDPVAVYARNAELWGNQLAANDDFTQLLREAIGQVNHWRNHYQP